MFKHEIELAVKRLQINTKHVAVDVKEDIDSVNVAYLDMIKRDAEKLLAEYRK